MQVSWIDAERIKALVEQIAPQEACVKEASGFTEINTTPETTLGNAHEAWGFAVDRLDPPVKRAPAVESTETFAAESEPPGEMEAETHDDGHGLSVPNPAATLPLSRIRDKLRAIRQRATDAGILTRMSEVSPMEPPSQEKITVFAALHEVSGDAAETDVCQEEAADDAVVEFTAVCPQASTFDMPRGSSREVRLAAFASWARQVLPDGGGQILVMSDDGEVLWGGEAKAGLALSTMMACGAAIRASAMSACETPPVIHQPLASGNVLTVIPCETAAGMVHAAVAAPAGLSHELAHLIRGALCRVMY